MQNINLLSGEYIGEQRNKILKSILGIGLAIELGITGIIALQSLQELRSKEVYLEEIDKKLSNPRFNEVKDMQVQLQEAKTDYEDWSNKLSQIKTESLVSGAVLDTLLGNVPVGVTIDYLKVDESSILMRGKTTNTFSARGYMSRLQNIYLEANMAFDLEEMQQGVTYSPFNIEMVFKEASHGEETIGKEGRVDE